MSGMKVGQRVTLNFKGRSITATVVKIEPSEQVTGTEVDDGLSARGEAGQAPAQSHSSSMKSKPCQNARRGYRSQAENAETPTPRQG